MPKIKRISQGNIGGMLYGTKETIQGAFHSISDKFTEQVLTIASLIGVERLDYAGDTRNEIRDITAIENIRRDAGIISTPGYYLLGKRL